MTAHSQNAFRNPWHVLAFGALLYNMIGLPFRLCFGVPTSSYLFAADCVADAIYLIDVILAFRMGLFSPSRLSVDTPVAIRFHRRRWLWLDLLTLVPFELLLGAPVWRLTRMLRIIHLNHYFKIWERRRYGSSAGLRLSRLGCLIVLVIHIVACCWFQLGAWEGSREVDSWIEMHQLVDDTVAIQYLHALYWAITTITTVGYGDITPNTDFEILFTLAVLLLGVSMWAYVIGSVASLVANLDSTATAFNGKVDGIKQYMKYRHIPRDLQDRVMQYYDFLWSQNQAFNDEDIFSQLPTALKTDILLYLNREILAKVPFFKGADSGFLHSVVATLKPQIFCPGDVIISHGEIGEEMYFINTGEVEVVSNDGQEVHHTYHAGDFFGELALLFSQRRTATVRARTHCDLFVLTKSDLDSILTHYPDFSEQLYEIGRERYRAAMGNENEPELTLTT